MVSFVEWGWAKWHQIRLPLLQVDIKITSKTLKFIIARFLQIATNRPSASTTPTLCLRSFSWWPSLCRCPLHGIHKELATKWRADGSRSRWRFSFWISLLSGSHRSASGYFYTKYVGPGWIQLRCRCVLLFQGISFAKLFETLFLFFRIYIPPFSWWQIYFRWPTSTQFTGLFPTRAVRQNLLRFIPSRRR